MGIAARPVEGQETFPDDLRVDVPAGQGLLCRLDQLGPAGLEDVRASTNGDLP